jgi:bisphosphoglycerate-dependent phosphoglycerate mutase
VPTLVLLRHGESQWNLEKPVYRAGSTSHSPTRAARKRGAPGRRLRETGITFAAQLLHLWSCSARRETLRIVLEEIGATDAARPERDQAAERAPLTTAFSRVSTRRTDAQALRRTKLVHIWRSQPTTSPPPAGSASRTPRRARPALLSAPSWSRPSVNAGEKHPRYAAHGNNSLRSIVMDLVGELDAASMVLELNPREPACPSVYRDRPRMTIARKVHTSD